MDIIEINDAAKRHPWELARAKVLTGTLLGLMKHKHRLDIADIGAGDCFFASELSRIMEQSGIAADIVCFDTGYNDATKTVHGKNITKANSISESGDNVFDMVLLLDVAEHVENDRPFFEEINGLMKDSARILVTVPAFQRLFSAHDTYMRHHRRYSRKGLCDLMGGTGYKVEKCHYFFFSLFLIRWLQKSTSLKQASELDQSIASGWKFPETHIATKAAVWMLHVDFNVCAFLAGLNIYIPGLSVLAIAKKQENLD